MDYDNQPGLKKGLEAVWLSTIMHEASFIFLFNAGLARPALSHGKNVEVTTDIFNRGLCLPSDNKQSREQGEVVIEVIKRCFL